jgi:hypothetical protein
MKNKYFYDLVKHFFHFAEKTYLLQYWPKQNFFLQNLSILT